MATTRENERKRGLRARLLRMPVFYKVLLANAAGIVVVSAAAGAAAHALLRGATPAGSVALFLLAGAVIAFATLPLYAYVLRLALRPLDALEDAAEEVARGRMDARARVSKLADPRLDRVVRVFNRLLDGLEADQRRLREVAARAFRAQEAERVRMAHELEGETAQRLSALLLTLRIARRAREDAQRERLLDTLRADLVALTDQMRDFAGLLHSPTLAEVGLVAALEAYGRRLSAHTGVEVQVRAGPFVAGALTPEGELAIYRVVQEALSNVLRHASATHARISVERIGGAVEAVVRDDGRGFDVDRTEAERACLGFFGMRERALYVGGEVEVESAPCAGTRVTVRVPVASAPARGRPALALETASAAA